MRREEEGDRKRMEKRQRASSLFVLGPVPISLFCVSMYDPPGLSTFIHSQ